MPPADFWCNSNLLLEVSMTKLLITGSRNASAKLIAVAKKAVEHAQALGWEIVVGDASGIDMIVINTCDDLNVPVTVYGANNVMRHKTKTGANITTPGSYIDRDVLMAEECDKCFAIWNGESRGTKLTYKTAMELHKEAWIFTGK